MFTDTITIFTKNGEGWDRKLVYGVQWSDKFEKDDNSGRISVARYASITFPKGTYEDLNLQAGREEDAIFLGIIQEEPIDVRGYRISDMIAKYPKSGRIKVVNDNTNRRALPNMKVVVA